MRSLVLLLAALCAGGCLEWRDEAFGGAGRCTSCHGSEARAGTELRKSAPPVDIDGHEDPSQRGVGAHENHLTGSYTHAPVACEQCHVVPADVASPGHGDQRGGAPIVFGTLATSGGRSPTYDRESGACATTYCHGISAMSWTAPRSSVDACGTCHGVPPPPPHAPDAECDKCHGPLDPALHVDGKTDFGAVPCDTCHAATQSGAHQPHLAGGQSSRPVACGECHAEPEPAAWQGHIDGTAGVTISGVGASWNAVPAWDRASATCSGTWCHGPWPSGASPGVSRSPVWTRGRPIGCTPPCHGVPPPAPHVQRPDCVMCHADVVEADSQTIKSKALHVDGRIALATTSTCTSCHEDASTFGGMHAWHLTGGNFSRPAVCDDCHRVPYNVWDTGHVDADGMADVSLAPGTYDSTSGTCSNTWCHGALSPSWSAATTTLCTASCHEFPPPPQHPPQSNCYLCHANVVEKDNLRIKDRTLHVNRTVNHATESACSDCHTTPNLAPPPDLSGNTSSLVRGVGAHDAHLTSPQFSMKTACADCHPARANPWDTAHLDGKVDVVFSGVASARGMQPTYDGSTCSRTYCHAGGGATNPSPSWTVPDGTKAVCGECHSNPPMVGMHPGSSPAQCAGCHSDVDVSMNVTDPSRHVDGVVDY